jgi:hypothetical protein
MAPPEYRFQWMLSASSAAKGSVTSSAAPSWIAPATRTSQGATKRF